MFGRAKLDRIRILLSAGAVSSSFLENIQLGGHGVSFNTHSHHMTSRFVPLVGRNFEHGYRPPRRPDCCPPRLRCEWFRQVFRPRRTWCKAFSLNLVPWSATGSKHQENRQRLLSGHCKTGVYDRKESAFPTGKFWLLPISNFARLRTDLLLLAMALTYISLERSFMR